MKRKLLGGIVALSLCLLSATTLHADFIVKVSLDTSVLAANNPGQGPFAIDFGLTDGAFTGDGNNKVAVTNLNLNGGSLTPGTDSSSGGASGSLSGNNLSITDSSVTNDFFQQFTPGSSLSFTVDFVNPNLSNAESANVPDEFSFTAFSNLTSTAPTVAVLSIDITGSTPTVVVDSGGQLENGVNTPAPTYTVLTAVPEPASLSLFALGLGTLALGAWRRRRLVAA